MQVFIPFQEAFRKRMCDGIKTQTARTKRYGKEGDTFIAFETMFQIVDVFKSSLGIVAGKDFKTEGFDNIEAFWHLWDKLHPRKRYTNDDIVWVHRFKRLP